MDKVVSYADKVRHQEFAWYDPMLEEARCVGHSSDEVSMEDAEVVVKAVHDGSGGSAETPHPIKTT